MAKRKAQTSCPLDLTEVVGDASFSFQGDAEVERAMGAAENAFASMMRIRKKLARAYQDLLTRS